MSNADRLASAERATQEAVHEIKFGRVDIAAGLLEVALKDLYAIRKDAPSALTSYSGQGR